MVYAAGATRVEEYIYLRAPEALAKLAFRVELGDGVRELREKHGFVEALDEDGVPRLRAHRPWIIDATGATVHGYLKLTGDRLVVTVDAAGLVFPVLVDPSWSTTGNMALARTWYRAHLVPDGRVIVFGCVWPAPVGLITEAYDPGTGTWSPVGDLIEPVNGCSVRLSDGRILDVSHGGTQATVQIFDPVANSWSTTSLSASPHQYCRMVLLPNGDALVVGASQPERFDPGTETWSPAGTQINGVDRPQAVLLPDGRVLVAGGSNGLSVAFSEIYDPSTNSWSPVGDLNQVRMGHLLLLLPDGTPLAIGGYDWFASLELASVETFDATSGQWSFAGSMIYPRRELAGVILDTGEPLITGGGQSAHELASCELYDATQDVWSSTASMNQGRTTHTATLLPASMTSPRSRAARARPAHPARARWPGCSC